MRYVLLLLALLLGARPACAQTYDPARVGIQQVQVLASGVRSELQKALSLSEGQLTRLQSLLATYDSLKARPAKVDTFTVVDSIPYPVLQVDTFFVVDTVRVTEPLTTDTTETTALLPILPQDSVDTTPVSTLALSGRVIQVASGEPLQPALDSARAGDVVELEAGTTWHGPVVLGDHGDGEVIIRSSRAGELPPGVRVVPEDSVRMAKLIGGESNRLTLQVAGDGWRLEGIEMALNPDTSVLPGMVTSVVTQQYSSSGLILDRSYIHGTDGQSLQRCVALNGARAAVINSRLDRCHAVGTDAQAIEGWYGPGPYLIQNNYLAGSGENIMFGGAAIGGGQEPSDIIIRGNYIHKPQEWRTANWSIKNLLEIKMARRLLIEDNVFDGNWPDAQSGHAIIWKSENRDLPEHPEYYTSDVTFRRNRIINSDHGIDIDGHASTAAKSGPNHTRRVLLEDVEMELTADYPIGVMLLSAVKDVSLNRVRMNGRVRLENGGHANFHMANSCTSRVMGSGLQEGVVTLDARAPSWTFQSNTITDLRGSWVAYYPTEGDNTYLTDGSGCP